MTGSKIDTPAAILGIDTATGFLSLALVDTAGAVLAESAAEVVRDHAVRIIPELDDLFAAAGLAPEAVRGICVGVGPGSYTGLRIGVATAKGLGFGWGVPVAGGDTLAAVAAAELAVGETGIGAIDARRGNVYFGIYRMDPEGPARIEPPAKDAREAVRSKYPGLRMIEGRSPSAAWHARRFDPSHPPAAVYL